MSEPEQFRPTVPEPIAPVHDAGNPAADSNLAADVPSPYRIVSVLTRDECFVTYRAQRLANGEAVLLKGIWARPEHRMHIDSLRREYALLRELRIPGVPGVSEFSNDGSCWLVMDDPGALPMREVLPNEPVDLAIFFNLTLQLSTILAELHRQEIVHRNIHPQNILIRPDTHQAWLLDFTFSCGAEPDVPAPQTSARRAACLNYQSPELSGRTNRGYDHRSDLYSLGVIAYELLTGLLPFRASDPLQLLHAHLAKKPISPVELRADIPETVCQIVLKLLEKMPDRRYQSARGLHADLQRCAHEWNTRHEIPLIELGSRDIPEKLLIPQKLYGRNQALESLVQGFEMACAGCTHLSLVSGYAGVGKTSLIQGLYPWIADRQAYFITGKFDQVVRNIPYGAVLQAFRALIRQILSEGDASFSAWRNRLSLALGANGGVLTEVIPEVELITGKTQPPAPMAAAEAQNRFRLVFQNFVAAIANAEHPLVLFLDDLQWADPASLALLQPLLTSQDVRFLFVIGAFRDNEIDATQALEFTLASLPGTVEFDRIQLRPLESQDLHNFAIDCLRRDDDSSRWLAKLLGEKTEGNPFFMIQFLRSLWRDNLLRFDQDQGVWQLDQEQISRVPMTDNVIELMSRRIDRLSPPARRVLTYAACIGNLFDVRTITEMTEFDAREVRACLREARNEGLIVSSDHHVQSDSQGFVFLHDRVQQAAYAQLEDTERQSIHLAVGRLLLRDFNPESVDDRLFDIVEHLNIGRNLISLQDERLEVVMLNRKAGLRAKSATAYQAALVYFETGCNLLGATSWRDHSPLMFELHIDAAECTYLCGRFEDAESQFNNLIARAASAVDKARVFALRAIQFENQSQFTMAAQIGAEGLRLLGTSFPTDDAARQATLNSEIRLIEERLAGRSIDSLVDLPEMQDAEKRMSLYLMTVVWASSYISGAGIPAPLLSARMVSLSIEFGNTADSAYGYVTHAITVGATRGDYRSAYAWGTLALAVNSRFDDHVCRAKIHQQFNAHVTLWRMPLQNCVTHAREACRVGMQNGDFTYAGYGAMSEAWAAFLLSRDLDHYVQEMRGNLHLLIKIRTTGLAAAHQVMLSWAGAYLAQTKSPTSLCSPEFEEAEFVKQHGENPLFMTIYQTAKLCLTVTHDDIAGALECRAHAKRIGWGHGTIWPVLLHFWGGLALSRSFACATAEEQSTTLSELEASCSYLGVLAENCPETFRCMFLVLDAERQRIQANTHRALESLDEAISWAKQTQNLQLSALAEELCGRLWLEHGNANLAVAFIGTARRSYGQWGAVSKVRQLEQRYPQLQSIDLENANGAVDVQSVVKAAHAVSTEVVLDALLRKIISIAMENAGATRAIFVREKDGRPIVEAEAGIDTVEILQSTPLDEHGHCAVRIVNYVRKAREIVIIGNAVNDNRFFSDPYVLAEQPKSILCVPVVHQGNLSGVLYLENDLATNAFTEAHVKVLDVLCAQAAISLENARLYHDMRDEIERRTSAEAKLTHALAEVESLKNRLNAENVYLQEEIKSAHNFEEIVGNSRALLGLLQQVDVVAPTNATVLIYGETGTGKELIARALHDRSPRRDRPLVKVNCGAISAGLVESELFGHVKGAFTGALSSRVGRFELADGGTIFLDEIGELPADTQVKLLRVLQEQEFEPVGSSKSMHVDVRVIAATNRNLDDNVRAGRFRADLYYRLNVIPLTVPPLRKRHDDIPQLAMFFLDRCARQSRGSITGIAPDTLSLLCEYNWPGNVRELQNVVERAVILSTDSILHIDPQMLAAPGQSVIDVTRPAMDNSRANDTTSLDSLEAMERRHIVSALERCNWVVEGPRGAAIALQQNPSTLRSRMKKLGISRAH